MAICLLNQDILRSNTCGYSLKQITDLYLANYEEVSATTLGTEGNTVASITMATGGRFYHIEPAKDSASYEDALQEGDSGSKYRTTTITWSMTGTYDGDMVDTLDALSLGKFMAVAKLTDGNYILFGRLVGLEAETASLSSDAEATGFNGIEVTLTADVVESPLPLEDTAIATVLAA